VQLDEDQRHVVDARIGLGAVAPTPLYAEEASELLSGEPIDDSVIARAADAACAVVTPITDMRGTESYRVHATGVMVRRVLEAAIARARGDTVEYRPGH
jgi:carbon-monoxide dehydrogenase medium subunit